MLTYRSFSVHESELLTRLLIQLDSSFPIPLSEKTELSSYAKKLLGSGTAYGAWEDGQPVGICGFYANDLTAGKAYVSVLGVLSSHQRRGIARKLLQDCLVLCRRAGMHWCCLYTHKTNLGAIALYRSFGFTEEITPQRPEDILFTKEL